MTAAVEWEGKPDEKGWMSLVVREKKMKPTDIRGGSVFSRHCLSKNRFSFDGKQEKQDFHLINISRRCHWILSKDLYSWKTKLLQLNTSSDRMARSKNINYAKKKWLARPRRWQWDTLRCLHGGFEVKICLSVCLFVGFKRKLKQQSRQSIRRMASLDLIQAEARSRPVRPCPIEN